MIGNLIKGGVEGIGSAVSEVVGTIWGNTRERETGFHEEQMAVLTQFAAEFAGRPPKTKWDSFVDGLNRLPRPVITISTFFGPPAWAYIDPSGFLEFVTALGILPEYYWASNMIILSFWFGGRLVNRDLRKPQLTKEQMKVAKDLVERRLRRRQDQDRNDEIAIPEEPKREPRPDIVHASITVGSGMSVADRKPEDPSPPELPQLPAEEDGQARIDRMIAALIEREGGFVDHPADRGGPTKYGVTRSTLANWRGSPVSTRDVRNLERSEASKIYSAVYYTGPSIDTLPVDLQEHVFDIAVNSGPRTGVRLLQRALNTLGETLATDGVIGPATRSAAGRHPSMKVNEALVRMRIDFYNDIVAGDPGQSVFIKGWHNRARSFLPGAAREFGSPTST